MAEPGIAAQGTSLIWGHVALVACTVLYLAWWLAFFNPRLPKAAGALYAVGVACIVGAAVLGITGVVLTVRGVGGLVPAMTRGVPVWAIAAGGIVAYVVLVLVTTRFFHRPVTTELVLFTGWLVLEPLRGGLPLRRGRLWRGGGGAARAHGRGGDGGLPGVLRALLQPGAVPLVRGGGGAARGRGPGFGRPGGCRRVRLIGRGAPGQASARARTCRSPAAGIRVRPVRHSRKPFAKENFFVPSPSRSATMVLESKRWLTVSARGDRRRREETRT